METMLQPRILMCAPDYFGIEYEINPWMSVTVKSDSRKAREQWSALVERLRQRNVAVDLIEPVADFPTWCSPPTQG